MTPNNPFTGLEPAALWAHFAHLTGIPRPSGRESAIVAWLAGWSESRGFSCRRDAAGNICIYVPASTGLSAASPLALQAHLDMVYVRAEGGSSDPSAETIEILRDGDWILAPSSTLGADNGIGIAAALCLAEDPNVPHGPLELLFTVEEETVFRGAEELDPGLVSARLMLNLDSEAADSLCIGCAGAIWTLLSWPAPAHPLPDGWLVAELSLSGLSGGHSGKDINRNHLNAIKGMLAILRQLAAEHPLHLCGLEGGEAFNAIPTRARAVIAFPPGEAQAIRESLSSARSRLSGRFAITDPGLSSEMTAVEPRRHQCWNDVDRDRLLDLLGALPSGVLAMEQHAPELVETSNNLGILARRDGLLEIHCLARSSVAAAQEEIAASIESAARLAGAGFRIVPPVTGPWRASPDSHLLAVVKTAYQDRLGREPVLATVHASVECGTLRERLPGLDILSFGPEIHNAHRVGECVQISSVAEFYRLLCEVVRRLAT